MDEQERTGVGAALRKPNKGPAGAVIRTVTLDEAETAFGDTAGDRGPALPGANKVGGPGGKGSIAGIRTGTKEAGGGLDARAAENMRIRRERAAAAGKGGQPATQAPQKKPAAQTPSQAPLEDWEVPVLEAQPSPPAAVYKELVYTPPSGTDALERGRLRALRALYELPVGTEIFVGGDGLGPEGVEFVMGLGLLIGRGLAVYRGDSHYRLNEAGRKVATEAFLEGA